MLRRFTQSVFDRAVLPFATVQTADNNGSLEGSYIYGHPQGINENNEPPRAENVRITGNATPGSLLTLEWDFISPSNYAQGTPTIQWKRKDKTTLIEEVLTGETNTTYQTDSGDNAYIFYADLVVSQTAPAPANGNNESETYTSNELLVELNYQELFKINYGGQTAVPGWINYNIGDGVLNDINGTGISLEITDAFQSDNNAGAQTGDDSGIVPDGVLIDSFRVGPADNYGVIKYAGFAPNQPVKYFSGGSRASGNQLTRVTVNGTALTYDPSQNTTIEIEHEVTANEQGELIIEIDTVPENNNGYHNWGRIFA